MWTSGTRGLESLTQPTYRHLRGPGGFCHTPGKTGLRQPGTQLPGSPVRSPKWDGTMTNPTVLIIEDDSALRSLQTRLARRAGFRVETASDGPSGLSIAVQTEPDLIVSDFHMPGMKGPELLRRLRAVPALTNRTILVVTGDHSDGARRNVMEAGANDIIVKPFKPADFRAHLVQAAERQGLTLAPTQGRSRSRPRIDPVEEAPAAEKALHPLEGELQVVLAAALERPCRADSERTRNHIRRVRELSILLARACGANSTLIDEIGRYAGLHDVGKASLPDHILRKPDLFTPLERQEMETHAMLGAELLRDAGLPETAVVIARHHHERWDGQGYPHRLAGEQIPLAARIVAIADVVDALRSSRSYRADVPAHEVEVRVRDLGGSHLDPMLVSALFEHPAAIDAIYRRHADPSEEPDLEVWR